MKHQYLCAEPGKIREREQWERSRKKIRSVWWKTFQTLERYIAIMKSSSGLHYLFYLFLSERDGYFCSAVTCLSNKPYGTRSKNSLPAYHERKKRLLKKFITVIDFITGSSPFLTPLCSTKWNNAIDIIALLVLGLFIYKTGISWENIIYTGLRAGSR
jgi:hypothetical protein